MATILILSLLLACRSCAGEDRSLLASSSSADPPAETGGGWRALEPGLDLGVFEAPVASTHGDSRITALRADMARYEPVLLMLSAERQRGERGSGWTAREWAERYGLVGAINAAMFQTDFETSTHYLAGPAIPGDRASPEHVNNPSEGQDNAMLAFDPVDPKTDPPLRLFDRGCGDAFADAHARYRARVQSIRMISCRRENVWTQQPKQWSHAVVGVDKAGRLLLIHARSPWTTHDFVGFLLDLPLDLAGLQYAEGGPEASLYVAAGGVVEERIGSYETGFYERDDNQQPAPLPNVIGLRPR